MSELQGGCWAPVQRHLNDDTNDWINLRLAHGLRIVREGSRYRIAADFPHGLIVTDLIDSSAYADARRELEELVRSIR
ncbi:hypothetical protein [Micromonospora taraxaci]|uniref:hypothetical protein n=1 Tax=Micromonospora taraxaci TaxID=1316803 RepID=UPI0011A8BE87|nr:hypothetical protein [Micromonospora taraxaci]